MKTMEQNGHKADRTERIGFSQLAAYGAGGIIPIALFNVAGILVGLMGNISLGLSAFWLGVILIIPRLWDALSDPVIGHISDNTRTRWGRRRPFLLFGGIAVAVFFVMIWWIPKGDMVRAWFPTDEGFQWFQLTYILFSLLIFFTAVSLFEIPHGALGMEMTNDYHERTRLFSAKSFVGNLFAMSTPWLFALANMEIFKGTGGNEADGMRYVSLMIAAVIIPLSFWWTYKLKEPGFKKVEKQKKSPFWQDMKRTANNKNFIMLTLTIFTLAMGFNFVSLLGSYIPIFYIFGGDKVSGATLLGINGTVWAITGLLAVFPLNWISPRLGKRNTLVLAILLMIAAQASKIVCYNPEYPYLIIIPTVLLSAGMLFFFTLGSSMVGDICDEDELHTGKRSEGSYYSVFWWFIKMGTALASFVAGLLIVYTAFDEVQVTKVDSLQGNIKELHSKTSLLNQKRSENLTTAQWIEVLKTQSADAEKELNEFLKYLDKETAKKFDEKEAKTFASSLERKTDLEQVREETRTALHALTERMSVPGFAADSMIDETLLIILQPNIIKARTHAFELEGHLKFKSVEKNKNQAHYIELLGYLHEMQSRIRQLSTETDLQKNADSLESIEKDIFKLTVQSPFTLWMMRVVEIGLPLLLSILSVFIVLRYSLTEKRSHEIKELINQRNALQAENSKE
ncbi:MAG TPA: MFS transporter [Bacteroidales bacterium]|nr:MFS transporter [Bacteroidales bacterium]